MVISIVFETLNIEQDTYTGRVITNTNYLATTASHFTQINKGYPLDKNGGGHW